MSLTLKYRVDKAYKYLQKNQETKAILSGGKGRGENISEAEANYEKDPLKSVILGFNVKIDTEQYNENVIFLRTPLIFMLPELRSSSYLLNEIGINNIGRFIIWADSELSDILFLTISEIKALREGFSSTFYPVRPTKHNFSTPSN